MSMATSACCNEELMSSQVRKSGSTNLPVLPAGMQSQCKRQRLGM